MPAMTHAPLGHSGLMVSRLCIGTMLFGGATDDATAERIVGDARDMGVNFIDTSNSYTDGRSEETIGRLFKAAGPSARSHWVLATKVANPVGKGPNERGLSRRHIVTEVEKSLKRLQTDVIDIYYTHKLDAHTPWETTVMAFGDLIRQGKVREWGLSNVRAWHIPHIWHLCRQMGVPPPTVLQPYYNLMNRQPELELIPAARAFGQGVVPYSPIARGILTGKYALNTTPEAGSRIARGDKRMMETEWRPESIEIAQKLKAHAEAKGATLVHWATAWVLNNRAVTAVIAGPRTFEQWSDYLGALGYTWTAEDEALADKLVVTGHPSTPGYNDPQYTIDGRYPVVA